MLTQSRVAPYLTQRELLIPQFMVEGNLTIADASRRNRNFRVVSGSGPSYLIKQGVDWERRQTVANEAAACQYLQTNGMSREFRRYLPHYYGYDPEEHIIIVELLTEAENLREHHLRLGRFPRHFGVQLARALSALHRLGGPATNGTEDSPTLLEQVPWPLYIHLPRLAIYNNFSGAGIQLIRTIQRHPKFCELLDELRGEWRAESLIHADLKWENCLLTPPPGRSRKTRLKIVDWELATTGDPCWDVGSVFNDYLSFWLLSIPITGEDPPERFLELARYPLVKMQPAIRAFWQTYARKMKLDAPTADEWLMRSVRYGAARLIQTAFEQMQTATHLTGNMVYMLQLSFNILQRPRDAAVHLLGIPPTSVGL